MKIKKDPVHREFKRAKGGEKRPKVLFSQNQNYFIHHVASFINDWQWFSSTSLSLLIYNRIGQEQYKVNRA